MGRLQMDNQIAVPADGGRYPFNSIAMNPYAPSQCMELKSERHWRWVEASLIAVALIFVCYCWWQGSYMLIFPATGQAPGNYAWNFLSIILPLPVLCCLLFFNPTLRRRPATSLVLAGCLAPSIWHFFEFAVLNFPVADILSLPSHFWIQYIRELVYMICCSYVLSRAVMRFCTATTADNHGIHTESGLHGIANG